MSSNVSKAVERERRDRERERESKRRTSKQHTRKRQAHTQHATSIYPKQKTVTVDDSKQTLNRFRAPT